MKLCLVLLVCFLLFLSQIFAQVGNTQLQIGGGYANALNNNKGGYTVFLQVNKNVYNKISIATEFEHLEYKQPNVYVVNPTKNPNQKVADNNFSLLFKYNLFQKNKFNISVATGATYKVKLIEYYDTYNLTGFTGEITDRNVVGGSFIEMPFIAEIFQTVSKKFAIAFRYKYNWSVKDVSTNSLSIGAALKL